MRYEHSKDIDFLGGDVAVLVDPPADKPVPDPQQDMNEALSKVHDALSKIEILFGANLEEFSSYLRKKQPDLDLTIDELWRRVDCEIYSKYLSNDLNYEFYKRWHEDLVKWTVCMIEATECFENWKRNLFSNEVNITVITENEHLN